MPYRIEFSPTSRDEILQAYRFITDDQNAPLNAARWLDGLFSEIEGLQEMPHRFAFARENEAFVFTVRQMVYKSHRILFSVQDQVVQIHRVVHTARRNLTTDEMGR